MLLVWCGWSLDLQIKVTSSIFVMYLYLYIIIYFRFPYENQLIEADRGQSWRRCSMSDCKTDWLCVRGDDIGFTQYSIKKKREPCGKIQYFFLANFWDNVENVLSGWFQSRALFCYQSEQIKIIHTPEWESNPQTMRLHTNATTASQEYWK